MKSTPLTALSLSFLSLSILASPVIAQTQSFQRSSPLISQQTQTILKTGTFVSGEHPTTGRVRIISENQQRYLEFEDNFKTDNGPDLFVILHRAKNVIGSTQPPAHSLKEGDYLTLAALKNVAGSQRYQIPSNVNLADYASVAIWCRQFNATFGAASLTP